MKYGSNPSPKCPPPNVPGTQPKHPGKKMTIQVSVTDTDKFRGLAGR
jgi:hypothetical protein